MNQQYIKPTSGWRRSAITFFDVLANFFHAMSALAIITMFILVSIQVIYRYLLNTPLGWTQELSVFAMMLAVMTGMAVAFWRGEHFKVSLLSDNLPKGLSRLFQLIASLITMAFLLVVAWQSFPLAMRAMKQISPTTGIPIGYIQLFLTIGSAVALLFLIARTILKNDTALIAELDKGEAI